MLRKGCKGRADVLGCQDRPEIFSHHGRRFFRDSEDLSVLAEYLLHLNYQAAQQPLSLCCLLAALSALPKYSHVLCHMEKKENKKESITNFCLPFFLLWAKAFAAPLGCRLSYLKPVMTPLYPSEWLICSLKECRWASLIGTWIFLKDVAGSGIGNITHNIK